MLFHPALSRPGCSSRSFFQSDMTTNILMYNVVKLWYSYRQIFYVTDEPYVCRDPSFLQTAWWRIDSTPKPPIKTVNQNLRFVTTEPINVNIMCRLQLLKTQLLLHSTLFNSN